MSKESKRCQNQRLTPAAYSRSTSRCSPRDVHVVSFALPRELVGEFLPTTSQVTRSPTFEKRTWVGRYQKRSWAFMFYRWFCPLYYDLFLCLVKSAAIGLKPELLFRILMIAILKIDKLVTSVYLDMRHSTEVWFVNKDQKCKHYL